MPPAPRDTLFISYSRDDGAFAERLVRLIRPFLDNEGRAIRLFFDRARLAPGDDYNALIADALDRSGVIVYLLSEHSFDDRYQGRVEIPYAATRWIAPPEARAAGGARRGGAGGDRAGGSGDGSGADGSDHVLVVPVYVGACLAEEHWISQVSAANDPKHPLRRDLSDAAREAELGDIARKIVKACRTRFLEPPAGTAGPTAASSVGSVAAGVVIAAAAGGAPVAPPAVSAEEWLEGGPRPPLASPAASSRIGRRPGCQVSVVVALACVACLAAGAMFLGQPDVRQTTAATTKLVGGDPAGHSGRTEFEFLDFRDRPSSENPTPSPPAPTPRDGRRNGDRGVASPDLREQTLDAPSDELATARQRALNADRPVLAVADFDVVGAALPAGFGVAVAEGLSQRLDRARFQTVERRRLARLLEERDLIHSVLVNDTALVASTGELLGATHLVVGTVASAGRLVQATARVVAHDATILEEALLVAEGPEELLLRLGELADALGVASPEVAAAPPPTRRALAPTEREPPLRIASPRRLFLPPADARDAFLARLAARYTTPELVVHWRRVLDLLAGGTPPVLEGDLHVAIAVQHRPLPPRGPAAAAMSSAPWSDLPPGGGRLRVGDAVRLVIHNAGPSPVWVYLLSVDDTGLARWISPDDDAPQASGSVGGNPLAPGATLVVPHADPRAGAGARASIGALLRDDAAAFAAPSTQQWIVVASAHRWLDLEAALDDLARTSLRLRRHAATAPDRLPDEGRSVGLVRARAVGAVRYAPPPPAAADAGPAATLARSEVVTGPLLVRTWSAVVVDDTE